MYLHDCCCHSSMGLPAGTNAKPGSKHEKEKRTMRKEGKGREGKGREGRGGKGREEEGPAQGYRDDEERHQS